MKLLRGVQHFSAFNKGVVATIGNFDGVHLGHQSLIRTLRAKANHLKLPLVLILFEPQPREFFQIEKAPARLSSLREKLEVLRCCQVDYIYCFKFNNDLAQTSAEDFARDYLFSMLNVKHLLVGEDFRFGKIEKETLVSSRNSVKNMPAMSQFILIFVLMKTELVQQGLGALYKR